MSKSAPEIVFVSGFPGQGVFNDLADRPVDGSGTTWYLNGSTNRLSINWRLLPSLPGEALAATTAYMRSVVESKSPSLAYNSFSALCAVLRSAAFSDCLASGNMPGPEEFRIFARDGANTWQAHYVRHWYAWCSTMGYPEFSPEIALELSRLRIGGNDKGKAVLSADPDEGPLLDQEVAGLISALRSSAGLLTLREQAVIWLCLALGPNPIQIALLREDDVKIIYDGDRPAFVHLAVPRMKKREAGFRNSFRMRSLTWEIGSIIVALIQENAERDAQALVPGHVRHVRPLIGRDEPKPSRIGTPLEEMSLHHNSAGITELLSGAVDKLNVPSRRQGERLKVTCRRLRYTFATRLVREGVSKLEIADLLDHTDTQHVQVYFDIKSDIVEKLDKATAMVLAPIAQAFMGQLVPDEKTAVRGDDPASKVAVVDKTQGAIREVGTCGEFSFCRLSAPVACYTCAKFQPWMDAPHHLLLDDLLTDRDRRREAGQDGRMVTLMDNTIIAIADVIRRVEAQRHSGEE